MTSFNTPVLLDMLSQVLGQVADPAHVLKLILERAVTLLGAERGLLAEVGQEGQFRFEVLHRIERRELSQSLGLYSRTLFNEVISTRASIRIEDARLDSRLDPSQSIQSMKIVSALCSPLIEEGRVVALLHLDHSSPGWFTPAHEGLIEELLEVATPLYRTLVAGRSVLAERDALRESHSIQAEELDSLKSQGVAGWSFAQFVGRSPALQELQSDVLKAAPKSFPVLLLGESGTGKSLLARALHSAGPRAQKPFITVFCPSMQKEMVEAELFGHKRGAFTGALSDRPGKVQAAEGGTLFLDEIGDLPLDIQPKLLRLLQEKTYERVGEATERRAEVRVVAATNRDLEAEVAAGRFRRDLFERLNFLPLHIPPLRERRQDIPRLLRHCLDQTDDGRWMEVTSEAEQLLATHESDWPGNVRAVEQLVARLIVDGTSPITGQVMKALLARSAQATSQPTPPSRSSPPEVRLPGGITLEERVREAEKECIRAALLRHPQATRAQLADHLGIRPATLYKKLREYGLGGEDPPV